MLSALSMLIFVSGFVVCYRASFSTVSGQVSDWFTGDRGCPVSVRPYGSPSCSVAACGSYAAPRCLATLRRPGSVSVSTLADPTQPQDQQTDALSPTRFSMFSISLLVCLGLFTGDLIHLPDKN